MTNEEYYKYIRELIKNEPSWKISIDCYMRSVKVIIDKDPMMCHLLMNLSSAMEAIVMLAKERQSNNLSEIMLSKINNPTETPK